MRNEYILRYYPIVGDVVRRRMRRLPAWVEFDDLHSEGVRGLIAAVERYSPEKERTFNTYVRRRIEGAISDYLRREDTVSRRYRHTSRLLADARLKLEAEGHVDPTPEQLRTAAGLTLLQYRNAVLGQDVCEVSLDRAVDDGEENNHTFADFLGVEDEDPFDKTELTKALMECLQRLDSRDRRIVTLYYFKNVTDAMIAVKLGLTASRVHQLRTSILDRLRRWIKRHDSPVTPAA